MSDASDRGWGAGWPDCQGGTIDSDFNVSGTRFPGGVRVELCELVSRLVQECKNRGYRFGVEGDPSYGCWGYNCRSISGSSSPSNHSWGLAVDINAPSNPHKDPPCVTDMPDWMPDLWTQYGFRWGGTYSRPDAMHYEYMGSPQDLARHTDQARAAGLGDGGAVPVPPEPPPSADVPAYPLPTGHWMGVESPDSRNHSGYYVNDQPAICQYQQRMIDRGWVDIGQVDGIFGPQCESVTTRYQREKGLAVDGLAGEQTWRSIWSDPIT